MTTCIEKRNSSRLHFFRPRNRAGDRAAMFPVLRFPPTASVDVVVKHDPRRPVGAARAGANIVQDENGSVAGEFRGRRNGELHLSTTHSEYRDDRPFSSVARLNAGNAIAVVAAFARAFPFGGAQVPLSVAFLSMAMN